MTEEQFRPLNRAVGEAHVPTETPLDRVMSEFFPDSKVIFTDSTIMVSTEGGQRTPVEEVLDLSTPQGVEALNVLNGVAAMYSELNGPKPQREIK
mgnify:CR=1 FL=1